mmetsp:Transcript_24540/g.39933  ORF Transcript_24540/g.39933 Transcript_24540/m.39933 type:complete len:90 (+) Transcript_24540:2373-2642(+)
MLVLVLVLSGLAFFEFCQCSCDATTSHVQFVLTTGLVDCMGESVLGTRSKKGTPSLHPGTTALPQRIYYGTDDTVDNLCGLSNDQVLAA